MNKIKLSVVGLVAAFAVLVSASSVSAAYSHTTTLKMGSKSSQVMELQKALNASSCKVATTGVGSAGMESSYFGAMTKSAVMCFQAANGLKADGVVGPMSGAKLGSIVGNAGGSTGGSTGGTTTPSTSGLSGGAGSVDSYKLLSTYNAEEVGEATSNVKVASLEVEASDSSDLALTAVKLVFVKTAGTETNFYKYAKNVTVWVGGTKVGSADASAFNKDNSYTATISLDSGAIVKANKKAEIVVAVSGVDTLDSGRTSGNGWTVDFRSVRFVDAQGAVITEDPGTSTVAFSFSTYASANNAEIRVALNDSDSAINNAHIIQVDQNDTTKNVPILSFSLEARNNSALVVDALPVFLTTSNSGGLNDVLSSVDLYKGSEKIDSQSITTDATTTTVTFTQLNLDLAAGSKTNFWVKANFNKVQSGGVVEGNTIKAEIGSTQLYAADVEDASGVALAGNSTYRTGTALGTASALYKTGISLALDSVSTQVTAGSGANDDLATMTIRFKATAFGADVYVADTASTSGTYDNTISVDKAGSAITTGVSSVITCVSAGGTNCDSVNGTNIFKISQGQTRTFEVSVQVTNGSGNTAGQYRALLTNLKWDTTDTASPANTYNFNLTDYKTSYVSLN